MAVRADLSGPGSNFLTARHLRKPVPTWNLCLLDDAGRTKNDSISNRGWMGCPATIRLSGLIHWNTGEADCAAELALLSFGPLSDVAAGQFLYFAEHRGQFVGFIIEGFLRVFRRGPSSGRENTIRYVRPGDLLGVVAALSGPSAKSVQTLRPSRIWLVDSRILRAVFAVA